MFPKNENLPDKAEEFEKNLEIVELMSRISRGFIDAKIFLVFLKS